MVSSSAADAADSSNGSSPSSFILRRRSSADGGEVDGVRLLSRGRSSLSSTSSPTASVLRLSYRPGSASAMTYCTRTRCSRYRMVAAVFGSDGRGDRGFRDILTQAFPAGPELPSSRLPDRSTGRVRWPRRGSPPLGRRNSGANGFGIRRMTWQEYGPLTADVALDRRAVDVALDSAHTFLNSSMSRSRRCTRRISSSRRSWSDTGSEVIGHHPSSLRRDGQQRTDAYPVNAGGLIKVPQ
jgi:hypothetical protein